MWIWKSIRNKRPNPRLLLLLTVGLLLLSATFSPRQAFTGETHRILILHSNEPEFPRTMDLMAGIKDVFSASATNIQYNIEYLDTKRYHKPEYISSILKTVFAYKFHDRTFDLILLSDDDALEFVLKHRDELFPGVPIVFCGVSAYNLPRIAGIQNVTGVSNVPAFSKTIELALQFHPSTHELIFVGCPKNLPGKLARDGIVATYPEFRERVQFTFWDDLHAEDVAANLLRLHDGQLVFIYGFMCDQSDRVLSVDEMGKAICDNSPVPVYSFWDYLLGVGIVGGNLIDSRQQGEMGARLALQVMHGYPPQNIPLEQVEDNPYMFDYKQLKKFKIPITALPAESIVINQPEPFYYIDKEYLWGGLGFMTALWITTLVLVANIRKRQRVEKELIRRQAFEQLISGISTRFIDSGPEKTSRTTDYTLQALGEFTQVDRCYLSWLGPGGNCLNSQGWNIADDTLPDPAFLALAIVRDRLDRLETVYVPMVARLNGENEPAKEYWNRRNVLSVVIVPISRASELVGALVFESVRVEKSWNEADFVLLKTVAEILGNAFERQLYESRLRISLQEAETAREKIDAILGSVADGLIVTDMESRVVLMNRAAEELLDVDLQQRLGAPVDALIREPVFRERLASLYAATESSFQMFLQTCGRGSEELRSIQVRTSIVCRAEGPPRGAVTILRDVTREQEIDRMKSEFISITAHELRTPLTSIIGYAEVMLNEKELLVDNESQRREFLSYILKKAEALENIINDLLDIGRIETGRSILLERKSQDILVLIQEVMAHYRLETSRHAFELQTAEDSIPVEMDGRKVTQVLDNLLSNSVKYSPAGGTIRIGCRTENQGIWVSVEDEGIGMSPDQVERMFDKFYRADTSNTAVGGLGLGMSIVKGIVEAHGGHIFVESRRGEGTRVVFSLPMRAPAKAQTC